MTGTVHYIAAGTPAFRSEAGYDTLPRAGVLRDTLSLGSDTTAGLSDTVSLSPLRPAQAAEVFGAESFMPAGEIRSAPEVLSLTDNVPVQMTALCLLLLYTYIVLRYRRETGQLFRMIFSIRKDERRTDDYNYMFKDFITGLIAAGFITIGLAAVKITGLLAGSEVLTSIQRLGPFLVIAAVSLTAAAIDIVQHLVLRITGVTTLSIGFIRRLLALRRLFFAVATVSTAPAVLLFALAEGGTQLVGNAVQILVYVFAGIVALFLIYYIYRSLRLFIEEKVSILLWMLYLCIVEVIPPAMILLTTLRSI